MKFEITKLEANDAKKLLSFLIQLLMKYIQIVLMLSVRTIKKVIRLKM